MMTVTGRTKLVGLFGYPVAHSISPQMHNAAFARLGLDWCYVPFRVAPAQLEQALRALPALGVIGVNITIPLKELALGAADEVKPPADLAGAVNTICCREGKLVGYNTDVIGFIRSLRERGENIRGRTALVLGAGGAARAAIVGLARMGASRIWIAALRAERERAARTAELARRAAPGATAATIEWRRPALRCAVEAAEVVVNATPIGMHPHQAEPPPIACSWLRENMLVYDMVYNPQETRLLAGARRRGCRTIGGLRMLVLQGAEAFKIWTGHQAPVKVMHAAAAAALEAQMQA